MARPSNAAVRRREIADALGRLLPKVGFAGASTKAIAREAGLSPGLVHHHFGAKIDILVAVVGAMAEGLAARRTAVEGSARERVYGHISAWLDPGAGADGGAVACWAAIGAEAALHPEVAAVYRSAVAGQVDALAADLAEAAPGRSGVEARALAAMVHASIEGAFRLHASAPGVIPEGSAGRVVRGLVDGWLEGA